MEVCIYGNGNIEPPTRPSTRGEKKYPCKIGPALEAFIINREQPKHIFVFANAQAHMLPKLGFCNTLQLICEAFFAAQKLHFRFCNTVRLKCSNTVRMCGTSKSNSEFSHSKTSLKIIKNPAFYYPKSYHEIRDNSSFLSPKMITKIGDNSYFLCSKNNS